MELCSDGHDEVCYEGSVYADCPVCIIIKEKDDTIEELTNDNEDLKSQVDTLESERTE